MADLETQHAAVLATVRRRVMPLINSQRGNNPDVISIEERRPIQGAQNRFAIRISNVTQISARALANIINSYFNPNSEADFEMVVSPDETVALDLKYTIPSMTATTATFGSGGGSQSALENVRWQAQATAQVGSRGRMTVGKLVILALFLVSIATAAYFFLEYLDNGVTSFSPPPPTFVPSPSPPPPPHTLPKQWPQEVPSSPPPPPSQPATATPPSPPNPGSTPLHHHHHH